MSEEPIALTDIESVLGIKISAAALPEIGERRIRIVFPSGAKMTIVISDEGKWQNAASFTSADGGALNEFIAVLHGSMEVATPGKGGVPKFAHYGRGSVATIDARQTHATHLAEGSCVVGIMSSDWQGVTRTGDPDFDAKIQVTEM